MNESLQVDTMPRLTVTLKRPSGEVIDISAASSKKVRLKPPTGEAQDFDVDFVTDGTDGKVYYDVADGQLTELLAGEWKFQILVTLGGKKYKSKPKSFSVLRNL